MSKPVLNVVVLGDTDSGKSTIVGHLLYNLGKVDENTMQQLQSDSEAAGKANSKYAWVSDTTDDEHQRGATMHAAICNFETDQYSINLIDTPGKHDCMETTIPAISQADCVLLIVNADTGAFEGGLRVPTLSLAATAFTFHARKMIVGVNKMDLGSSPFLQERYNEIIKELSQKIQRLGYHSHTTSYVPLCGLAGDNLTDVSGNMPWNSNTLMGVLNAVEVPSRDSSQSLRLPILSKSDEDAGTFINGRVQSGSISNNMQITIMPSNVSGAVASLEINGQAVDSANEGDFVKFTVADVDLSGVAQGNVVGSSDDPPKIVSECTAQVKIIAECNEDIGNGFSATLFCHTASSPCTFQEIISTFDHKTGEVIEDHPENIDSGHYANVRIAISNDICLEKGADFPRLGYLIFRDDYDKTFAVASITDVVYKDG